MKCPKCGYEWTEGHLYCDNCGEEFRIVPDFEPEIEEEMNETLSTLLVELAQEEMPELEEKGKDKERIKKQKSMPHKVRRRKLWMAAAIVFCIFAASIGIAGVYWHRNYSLSYQIGKAKECAQGGQYTQAIIYLEKARTLDGENGEILFLMADYYYIQEKYELAIDTLIEIVEAEERYSEAEVESAYDKVISIYSKMENYQAIHELLSDCTNEAVVNLFQQFIAKPPEFSFVEGNYEEVLPLKLSANTSGKIY